MPSNEPRADEDGARLRIDVLGPLRVRDASGRDVTPEGVLQRRLLALLVLRRGRVVSVDAAVDVLWPERPPRDPTAALHNHVFRLRREFPDGVVEWMGNGYRLDPSSVDVDADRVAEVVNATAADDVTAAVDVILDQWNGPAYPELGDVDDGRIESERLAELRLRVEELRAERRLAAGDTDGLVADLAAMVERDPLRERPRALLMSALAATGRQAEALRVYDDFRRRLSDELGIDPSPSLAMQHADLLANAGVAAWTPPHRLPVPATTLLGREALVAAATALAETHRLVSLVGTGGVGKTRLLVEVGHHLRDARPDRPVVMCELATAASEAAVDVVATALAIEARPGVGLAERVAAVLADAEAVLLLDNCEHVIEVVAELVERIVATCPDVTVITTSRERLRLPGEQLVAVAPLPMAADDAAVQLFVERARAVSPDFDPDADELATIAEIARRLDGLPLAIELAAARLHALDVAEISAGLDHRFALLAEGYRTSSRHGSLAAAMSWSVGLLDEPMRRIFTDLSAFAGSFTAADAAAVCGADTGTVTAALHQLVERSLVMRAPRHRYALLETLRAFGAEQLAATGRTDEVGERHAIHQVEWLERARVRLTGSDGSPLTEIDDAIPELRTALTWLLDHDRIELAGHLVEALFDYGFLRLRPDVLAWSERVAAADPDDRSPRAAMVWATASYAAWMAGDIEASLERSRRGLEVGERSGAVPPTLAMIRGNNELIIGRLEEATSWYRRAAALAADDPVNRLFAESTELLPLAYAGNPSAPELGAKLLAQLGDARTPHASYVWYCAGEADLASGVAPERARSRLARAIEIAEETHASFVTGVAGASKASIDARDGDPVAAADDYRRLVAHWHRAGMWPTQWTMLRSIAGLLARLERSGDAAVLLGAVLATRAGHRIFGADEIALAELGTRLRAALGDDAYEAALRDGATLDGGAVVEHALRSL